MKLLSLSVCSMLLFLGVQADKEVESVRQATIPSKKVIHKKPVGEVKAVVDAGAVPKKATGDVDPFSGGTGGVGARKGNRRDVSIDDGVLDAGASDDLITRILTGTTGNKKDAAGSKGDFEKTIRQMTQEITKNLSKDGGLEKMLEHPSVRQATEAISKVLTASKDGSAPDGDKMKSLREMTQEVMKNIDVGEVMKNFNPEMLKNISPELMKNINPELLKNISPELMKNFNPEMLKNISPEMMKGFNPEIMKNFNLEGLLKDLPKGGNQNQNGGKDKAVDYASILDSFLGKKDSKVGAEKRKQPVGSGKKGNYADWFDSYDSTEDDMFDFFGKEDF